MIEQAFTRVDSIISDIDPRIRIVYAVIFSVIVAITDKVIVAGLALAFSMIFLILVRLNIKLILRRLLIVNFFIIVLWFILPFSLPGNIIFSLGNLNITYEGIVHTLLITIKCNAIVLTWIAMISSCGIFELVHAFSHLHIPDKLIYLFFLLYRYVYVLSDEYGTLRNTLRVRGFRPRTSLLTYRTYGYVIGTLLLRSYDLSEQVHKAMICRGFKGKYWLLDHFKIDKMDFVFGTFMLLSIISLGILQWAKIIH
ncbi:MAG: cobalt ECF transporter T component CbiQ [bacterium]